jgi:hypothetical protein
MVTGYGMSDRLRLVSYERPRHAMFLPEAFSAGKKYRVAKAANLAQSFFRDKQFHNDSQRANALCHLPGCTSTLMSKWQ